MLYNTDNITWRGTSSKSNVMQEWHSEMIRGVVTGFVKHQLTNLTFDWPVYSEVFVIVKLLESTMLCQVELKIFNLSQSELVICIGLGLLYRRTQNSAFILDETLSKKKTTARFRESTESHILCVLRGSAVWNQQALRQSYTSSRIQSLRLKWLTDQMSLSYIDKNIDMLS